MNRFLEQVGDNKEVINWINTTLKKYLTKNVENYGEIEHILDYLKSDKAPKRLQKMSYTQAKTASEKWMKSLTKKGKNIDDTDGIKGIIRWKKSGMRLVKLVSKESYEKEGNLMGHCVSSYYGRSDSTIYSLRDKDNLPHCTIEVLRDGSEIQQIKGKGNGHIHPKYIHYVLRILKKFDIKVSPHDMINLGYIHLTDKEKELISTHLPHLKIAKLKDEFYLYNEKR